VLLVCDHGCDVVNSDIIVKALQQLMFPVVIYVTFFGSFCFINQILIKYTVLHGYPCADGAGCAPLCSKWVWEAK
jgi:hypothetical protein